MEQNTEQLKKIEEVRKETRLNLLKCFHDALEGGYSLDDEEFQAFAWSIVEEGFNKLISSHDEIKREAIMDFAKYVDEAISVDIPNNHLRNWAKEYLTQSKEGGE